MKFDNYAARTRETLTHNQEIARTILEQLGRQFVVLTGASQFVALESGLQFNIGSGAKDGISKVRIILTPADDYTLIFYKKTRNPVEPWATVDTVEGVYCDNLQDVFESHTNFYVTLSPRR
jgi:hypothetical protein